MRYLILIILFLPQVCFGQEIKTYAKGLNKLTSGEYDSAIYYFSQVLDYDRSVLIHRGKAYLQKLESFKAMKDFSYALVNATDSTEILYYRSLSFIQLQNFDSAARDIRIGLRMCKEPRAKTSFYYAAGLKELATGHFREAILEFNKTFPTFFENPDLLEKLSFCHLTLSEPSKALEYATKAASLNKSSYSAHYLIGHALTDLRKYYEAIDSFNTAISIIDNAWESYLRRGQCFYMTSDFENARLDLELAIKLNPKDANAYIFMGYMAKLENQKQEACTFWSKAIELGADDLKEEFKRLCGK